MTKYQIRNYEKQNAPFFLTDLENGLYSLGMDRQDYKRTVFNSYCKSKGEPIKDRYGLYLHGSGYEWEELFQKAFEDDPRLEQLSFDSEVGAFYCYSENPKLLADMGRAFKKICDNDVQFLTLVEQTLGVADQSQDIGFGLKQ